MKLRIAFPLSLALAMASLQAQTPGKIETKTTNTKARLSNEAGDMLQATSQARTAIQARNKQDAIFHIDHALAQAMLLNASGRQFIPLYDEWENYSVIGPLINQRNRQRRQNEIVEQASAEYTSVALDVQAAKIHLQEAQQAVNRGAFQKADAALVAVQNGVVATIVSADLPLLRARENMVLARQAADRDQYGEAHTALRAASDALNQYANGQTSHAADARSLQSEIDIYNQNIQQNHTDAAAKIENWWDRITDWIAMPSQAKRG